MGIILVVAFLGVLFAIIMSDKTHNNMGLFLVYYLGGLALIGLTTPLMGYDAPLNPVARIAGKERVTMTKVTSMKGGEYYKLVIPTTDVVEIESGQYSNNDLLVKYNSKPLGNYMDSEELATYYTLGRKYTKDGPTYTLMTEEEWESFINLQNI